jgi:tetratricopeptide (TPR) repeat protein
MDSSKTAASAIASEIARTRALLKQQKFSAALEACEGMLVQAPEQRDALLFAAVAQRYLGRVSDALGTLEILERHHPRFSRLYEERGRCFVDIKQARQAIEAFEQAVTLNHSLPGGWSMLAGLYRMIGRPDSAETAAGHAAALQNLPPEVVTATGLFVDGDLDPAESLVRTYLLQHGDHIEAMRLLAGIGIARKVYDDAELLLAAVLRLAPGYRAARREYAGVLAELHRYGEARRQLDLLLESEPDNRDLRTTYAFSCVGLGEHERAIELYTGLLEDTPADTELHLSIAHALKTLGRRDEAVKSYHKAAACRPDFGDAYWSLANLKTYRFTDEELTRMRAAESAPTTGLVDRYHLSFALGKALEDRTDYDESFRYYERGNELKRTESTYRPEVIENNTRQQIEICTAELFADRRGWGSPDRSPIFIVGLPRSGSTLLEQILASHSQVEGTQELPNIQQIVHQLRGRVPDMHNPRYPRILAQLTAEDVLKLGEHYLAGTRAYRAGRPFFIDKMPNNFRHLGLIRLMLPNARIIDARREPMACCFSNFKQLFANGQEFTYGINDIAGYYRTYLELMRHWDRVLPGHILRIHHEDVVDDLDGNVRRVLDFCGLDFEPQCIEFHKTERSVRTASSEQVRQPLYREGLDQWKYFGPWLGPLQDALGDALHRYRDAEAGPKPARSSALEPALSTVNC